MDLSVIIPCHNLENYITPLLVSLRLQLLSTYRVELIFVCDGCTDKTEEKIDKFDFSTIYQKVQIIACNAGSCGVARNTGREYATGNYTLFLDGDDWLIDPLAIQKILNTLIATGSPVIRFAYEAPGFHLTGKCLDMVWQYAYKSDFIEDIYFDNQQPAEDKRFNIKVFKKLNSTMPYLKENLYHYNYMRENSNMQQLFKKGHIEY